MMVLKFLLKLLPVLLHVLCRPTFSLPGTLRALRRHIDSPVRTNAGIGEWPGNLFEQLVQREIMADRVLQRAISVRRP